MESEAKTIDGYIALQPKEMHERLQKIRRLIKDLVPEAAEAISYGMPAFKLGKNLVFFAAHTNHIGFYPLPSAIRAFSKELADYPHAKGSVQFPSDRPVPYDLIKKIVEYRVREIKP